MIVWFIVIALVLFIYACICGKDVAKFTPLCKILGGINSSGPSLNMQGNINLVRIYDLRHSHGFKLLFYVVMKQLLDVVIQSKA